MQGDFDQVLNDRIEKIHGSCTNAQQCARRVRRTGFCAAVKTLSSALQLSLIGMLHFDIKLGNLTWDRSTTDVRVIDVDPFMCTRVHLYPDWSWKDSLLVHVAILLAHVRRYRVPDVANGWVRATRRVLLELCAECTQHTWLFRARARAREYTEECADTPESAIRVFESVVHAYFSANDDRDRSHVPGPLFLPRRGPSASPLIVQLVRYGLTGSTTGSDAELSAALQRDSDKVQ